MFERAARIRVALPAVEVAVSEEQLRDVEAVLCEVCGVALHELGLPDGGAGLPHGAAWTDWRRTALTSRLA